MTAKLVANYFIFKANEDKKTITNKKLQKLLYYAQAWNLVFNKEPLFKEDIEAWIHGPTVREVYYLYKKFDYGPIDQQINKDDISKLTLKERKILGEVWRFYGKYDADFLEELTHNEKPWQEARENLEQYEPSTNVISLKSMKEYYKQRLENAKT